MVETEAFVEMTLLTFTICSLEKLEEIQERTHFKTGLYNLLHCETGAPVKNLRWSKIIIREKFSASVKSFCL